LNSVTARLIPGTHAQNVIGVADELQALPPARMLALALALALAVAVLLDPAAADEEDDPLLLHAASSEMAAAPATAADTRAGRRVMARNGFLDLIVTKLLCLVLPCFLRLPLSPGRRGVRRRWPSAPTCWSSRPR
jgi:hypothetical protein